jgi:ribosome-associated protein
VTADAPERARRRAVAAAQAAADKKGADILILDVSGIIAVADMFVITSAGNVRQVRTIAEEVEQRLKQELGVAPMQTEGLRDATWVLLDYGDVVVHVFLDETREYYGLQRLWADAPRVSWEAPGPAAAGARP